MKGKNWFTLIELLIVVAIIGILVSLLYPSIAKAREASLRSVCASNMSQLSKAYAAYNMNNKILVSSHTREIGGHAPAWILHSKWNFDTNVVKSPLWPYIGDKAAYRCANETRDKKFNNGNYKRSYSISNHLNGKGWHGNIVKTQDDVLNPSGTIQFLDEEDPRGTNDGSYVAAQNTSRWVDWPANNHGDKIVPLSYLDGHVENYVFQNKATAQITWFWSTEGYDDRVWFMKAMDPLD